MRLFDRALCKFSNSFVNSVGLQREKKVTFNFVNLLRGLNNLGSRVPKREQGEMKDAIYKTSLL